MTHETNPPTPKRLHMSHSHWSLPLINYCNYSLISNTVNSTFTLTYYCENLDDVNVRSINMLSIMLISLSLVTSNGNLNKSENGKSQKEEERK